MNRKIILQALCGLLMLTSIGFIFYVASLDDLQEGIRLFGYLIPLKTAEVLFVIYYLLCMTLFVKSFFTK